MYDSAFVAHPPVRSFAQSNIYRVLQRRMLAVRLLITGRFRCNHCTQTEANICVHRQQQHSFYHNSSVSLKLSIFPAGPSSCEEERRAATEAHSVYIPSCELGGAFSSRQCQQGGQCWCVDHTGQELPGTRQQGLLDCSECPNPGAGIFLLYPTNLLCLLTCSSAAPLIQQIWVLIAVPLCATVHSSTCFLVLLLYLSRPPSITEVKPPVLPLFIPSGIFCQWR